MVLTQGGKIKLSDSVSGSDPSKGVTDNTGLPAGNPFTPSSSIHQQHIHVKHSEQHQHWPERTARSIVSLSFNTAAPQSVSIQDCLAAGDVKYEYNLPSWCRPLMVNKPVSTRSPPTLPSLLFSLFRCNWHDSYTSSSLSSQQAVKNEPRPLWADVIDLRDVFRASCCWIVMFTCITILLSFFSLFSFNDAYLLSLKTGVYLKHIQYQAAIFPFDLQHKQWETLWFRWSTMRSLAFHTLCIWGKLPKLFQNQQLHSFSSLSLIQIHFCPLPSIPPESHLLFFPFSFFLNFPSLLCLSWPQIGVRSLVGENIWS